MIFDPFVWSFSKKSIEEFVNSNAKGTVAFYEVPEGTVVWAVEWYSDILGRYCIINTNHGKFAFHQVRCQVIPYGE